MHHLSRHLQQSGVNRGCCFLCDHLGSLMQLVSGQSIKCPQSKHVKTVPMHVAVHADMPEASLPFMCSSSSQTSTCITSQVSSQSLVLMTAALPHAVTTQRHLLMSPTLHTMLT